MGIIRAMRNICYSHADDYIADGTFESTAELYRYFLYAFPWLIMEIRAARAFGGEARVLAASRALAVGARDDTMAQDDGWCVTPAS